MSWIEFSQETSTIHRPKSADSSHRVPANSGGKLQRSGWIAVPCKALVAIFFINLTLYLSQRIRETFPSSKPWSSQPHKYKSGNVVMYI